MPRYEPCPFRPCCVCCRCCLGVLEWDDDPDWGCGPDLAHRRVDSGLVADSGVVAVHDDGDHPYSSLLGNHRGGRQLRLEPSYSYERTCVRECFGRAEPEGRDGECGRRYLVHGWRMLVSVHCDGEQSRLVLPGSGRLGGSDHDLAAGRDQSGFPSGVRLQLRTETLVPNRVHTSRGEKREMVRPISYGGLDLT